MSFVTGVKPEKHEFLWKIQNWVHIQKNRQLVSEQYIIIDTTKASSSVPTKWLLGMRVVGDQSETIQFYCRLIENTSGKDEVFFKLNVVVCPSRGQYLIRFKILEGTFKEHETRDIFQEGDEFKFNQPLKSWGSIVQEDGSISLAVVLIILKAV